jgi:hypothetical protein
MIVPKVYLGDGVYAEFDGYHVLLTAESGIRVGRNEIFLEPAVLDSLGLYVDALKKALAETQAGGE